MAFDFLDALGGLKSRIGGFINSAAGDVGSFGNIIRQSLRPSQPKQQFPLSPIPDSEMVNRGGFETPIQESDILGKLRETLTKGEKGEGKKKEEKPQMGNMTITHPTQEGGKITIKVDVPTLQKGFEKFGQKAGIEGAPPIATASPQLAELGNKLPNPLLPAILSLMESRGLLDKRPAEASNPFNIMPGGNLTRYPDLKTSILGGGGRLGLAGLLRQGGIYEPYLQSGDLRDFFSRFTPEGQGNPSLEELLQRYQGLRGLFTQ